MISQNALKHLINYDPLTGDFIWLVSRGNRSIGSVAGWINLSDGYRYIKINGEEHPAHRLAFLYMLGKMPVGDIDHTNHNRLDNQWSNLRSVTHKTNCRNHSLSNRNKSGVCGVHFDKSRNKWLANIRVNDKTIHLGRFLSKKDAVHARNAANNKYGFHSNHGSTKQAAFL